MTSVTSPRPGTLYILLIASANTSFESLGEATMMKFYSLIAAAVLFMPVALATLTQAANIVA